MGNVVLFMSRRGLSVLCGRQSERIRKFVGIRRERVVAEMRMVTAWVGTGAQNTDELQGKPRGAADGARGGTERNRRFKGSPGVGGPVLSPEERRCFLQRRDVGEWRVLKKNISSNLEMHSKRYLQSP